MSSPRKESPKGKEPAAAPRCSGRNGAAVALDPSALVAQFNREMLQVRPARVSTQGAVWGVEWGGGWGGGTGSLSCELWGGVRGGEG